MRVHALVVTGYGTNCEQECAYAAQKAGADAVTIAFFFDLLAERVRLTDFQFLILPGGFLDGDDLGAAQAAAVRWRHARTQSGQSLVDDLAAFLDAGGIILGICNGFQLLVKLGLLPGLDGQRFVRQVSLGHNDSARFEDRWVSLRIDPASPCVFTRGLDGVLEMPVRHGEGKLITASPEILSRIQADHLAPVAYCDPATGLPTQDYPANPNGSPMGIAGLTDPTGRIFGLMPHPEAFNHFTNHPRWTRGERPPLGLEIFARGIEYLRTR
ncbi:MAG: putative phosphoribosylformylglycinamidine synthase [Desulfomicrobiaceae bacterium]|jgi:phosphoribosylformylglycinamidine synthase|nr:putative phosphoribosylformylglycinamidine synthase [Desulfomicrobiaceae bacterium]MDI3493098.1 phosphoribosylformylglycinamidine synthase subunit PurQ / glutaminase [Desulfomicrobiaceae bacterium]MDK2873210.1 phosphoribosylformylglycinamidine synthase subunit PurQ / glutaminase [Desulfomicrobiaceae bacterium]HCF05133.1 phosphoribosylformylglycinamidine synthase [Desulfomicrobiaceae bacterium]